MANERPKIIIGKNNTEIKTDKWTDKTWLFYDKLKAKLEEHYGLDLNNFLTSGYRTQEENDALGAKGHRHVSGEAIDIAQNNTIYHYLWNTDEGLGLMEEAGFGMYSKEHGTGPHMHVGADVSKNVLQPGPRRQELKREGSDELPDVSLKPDEITAVDENYLKPEIITQELQDRAITDRQRKGLKIQEEINKKVQALDKAKKDYDTALLPENGNVEEIAKTKQAFEEAYYDAYVAINENDREQNLLKEKDLEKMKKDYTLNSVKGKYARKELTALKKLIYVNGKDGKKLPIEYNKSKVLGDLTTGSSTSSYSPLPGTGVKVKTTIAYKDSKTAELLRRGNQLSYDLNVTPIEVTDQMLNDEIAKRSEKRDAVVSKMETINNLDNDKEQAAVDKETELSNQEKLAEKERLRLEQEKRQQAILDAQKDQELMKQAENYLSRFNEPQELIKPQNFNYDAKDYKRQIPFEAIGQGLLGLQGMSDAKKELPLREDEVSYAIKQYTADLKRLSEQGLKPEEEALFKDQLAGMYKSGIDQLVRASAGDRNVVLGNLPQLNVARMRELGKMQALDVQIKQQNFEKYGEMIKYLDSFQTKKNIDNYNVKLQDTQQKRQAGAALAQSGFASMLEELQYQKENGPGSANHRLKKAWEIYLTGVDSEIKDNGKGNIANTASYNQRLYDESKASQQTETDQWNTVNQEYDTFMSLPQQERTKYSSYQEWLKSQREPKSEQQPLGYGSGFMGMFGG